MIVRKVALTILMMVLVLPGWGVASQPGSRSDCPQSVAVISNNYFSQRVAEVMARVYQKLGCSFPQVVLPGRRGIKAFNHAEVDGELLRYPRVEPQYERPFVRSGVPMMVLSNSLWLHPDPEVRKNYPVGYRLGVLWQEEQSSNFDRLSFNSKDQLLDAYKKGRLGGFLYNNASLKLMRQANGFASMPEPVHGQVLTQEPLYHYLSTDYAPFMKRLSAYLKTNNPFSELE